MSEPEPPANECFECQTPLPVGVFMCAGCRMWEERLDGRPYMVWWLEEQERLLNGD